MARDVHIVTTVVRVARARSSRSRRGTEGIMGAGATRLSCKPVWMTVIALGAFCGQACKVTKHLEVVSANQASATLTMQYEHGYEDYAVHWDAALDEDTPARTSPAPLSSASSPSASWNSLGLRAARHRNRLTRRAWAHRPRRIDGASGASAPSVVASVRGPCVSGARVGG